MQRTSGRIATALASLVLAFALLTALFQANTRYFFCESMGLLRADPCATATRYDDLPPPPPAEDELSRTPFTCCATGLLGTIPPSTALAAPRVDPARLVAVVDLPRAIHASSRRAGLVLDPARPVRGDRWRIPPRPARERRAQSMIFLT